VGSHEEGRPAKDAIKRAIKTASTDRSWTLSRPVSKRNVHF
jgi:hypothetical protein